MDDAFLNRDAIRGCREPDGPGQALLGVGAGAQEPSGRQGFANAGRAIEKV
jgi:hypothetical protein